MGIGTYAHAKAAFNATARRSRSECPSLMAIILMFLFVLLGVAAYYGEQLVPKQSFCPSLGHQDASQIRSNNPLGRIVIAAHHEEDVSWLNEVTRHWQVAIVGPGGLAANKGNEAMAYLTYIIQNYDNLPKSMAFIHSHKNSWHTSKSQLEMLLGIPCWEKLPYASIVSGAFIGEYMYVIPTTGLFADLKCPYMNAS